MGAKRDADDPKANRVHSAMRYANPPHCFAVAVAIMLLPGCSDRLTVTGSVKFADGTPLDEGMVICEKKEGKEIVQARGQLSKDGRFRLGTFAPGDGVSPGHYRVLVVPRGLTQAEMSAQGPIIDPKYSNYATSGITFEVKSGANSLDITVTKPVDRH
jgi:hypothetical protein